MGGATRSMCRWCASADPLRPNRSLSPALIDRRRFGDTAVGRLDSASSSSGAARERIG